MIDYIKGEIVDLTPARMVMECGGIGYDIQISLTTFTAFQGKAEGKIYIYEVIREDAHLLFGFAGTVERELFLLLTSVSGVGPNTARMILSSLQPTELIQAIASKDEVAEVAEEAVAALVMLGFQKSASQKVVISILKENPAMKVEQVIKSALKML